MQYRQGSAGVANRPAPVSPNRGRSPERGVAKRSGFMGWWLDLTAPPRQIGLMPIQQRERIRKAELTSYVILAVFGFLLALISNSLASPSTAVAVVAMAVGLIIAALLNRFGRTRVAAYFVPALLALLIALSLVGAPGLLVIGLPIYDLFVIPIFVSSLIADRRAPWVFGVAAIAFIVADFLLQPHALINAPNAHNFDDVAFETSIYGIWGMINRHVALSFFAAFFGWLGARSVDAAIARADQAEEIAALEGAIAAQKRQLDIGVQHLLETHVRAANGDYSARAPLGQDNVLFQVAASLNNLLSRLQKSGQAEFQLRRTEQELHRLAGALDDVNSGRRPIWPAPSGTAVDEIIQRLNPTAQSPAFAPFSEPGRSGPVSPYGQYADPRRGQPRPPAYSPAPYASPPAQLPNPWSMPGEDGRRTSDLNSGALGDWGYNPNTTNNPNRGLPDGWPFAPDEQERRQ